LQDELDFFGMLMCSHVVGDTIYWKPGMNLIEKAARAAQARPQTTPKYGSNNDDDDDDDDDFADESFFTFFTPPRLIAVPETQLPPRPPKVKVQGRDDDDDDDDDDDERDELLCDDFDLGEALKDRVRAVS
jgi:nucleosome assembly protein 1-like 1